MLDSLVSYLILEIVVPFPTWFSKGMDDAYITTEMDLARAQFDYKTSSHFEIINGNV